jgi:hypothetical protein
MRPLYYLSLCLLLAACASQPTPGPEASSLIVTDVVNTVTEPAPEPETSSLNATGKVYPLTTATGNADIDPVLAALSTGDRQDLVKRFAYLSTACQTVNALGGPPACRDGEAEGTVVSVLPVLSSEGSFIHADSVDMFEGLNVAGIHAIFQNSDSAYTEDLFPAGEYTILLTGAGPVPGYALRVTDGQVVRLEYYYDLSTFESIQARDAGQLILEPLP